MKADRGPAQGLVAIVYHASKAREAERMERALLDSSATGEYSVARYPGAENGGIHEAVQQALRDGAKVLGVGGGDGTLLRILDSVSPNFGGPRRLETRRPGSDRSRFKQPHSSMARASVVASRRRIGSGYVRRADQASLDCKPN